MNSWKVVLAVLALGGTASAQRTPPVYTILPLHNLTIYSGGVTSKPNQVNEGAQIVMVLWGKDKDTYEKTETATGNKTQVELPSDSHYLVLHSATNFTLSSGSPTQTGMDDGKKTWEVMGHASEVDVEEDEHIYAAFQYYVRDNQGEEVLQDTGNDPGISIAFLVEVLDTD